MRTAASQGGKNSSGYAFAHGKLDQIETGRKGGSAPHKNRRVITKDKSNAK